MKYDYYKDQLGIIDFKQKYPATVRFKDQYGETHFMDVNEESAKAIIHRLIEEFNIVPAGNVSQMNVDEMWVAFGNFCQAINNQNKKK